MKQPDLFAAHHELNGVPKILENASLVLPRRR
jgi:hypothetical protein